MKDLLKSTGTIHYSLEPTKVVLQIDQGIADFYRSLIPKTIRTQRPMYAAHISLVRKADPTDWSKWGLHEGEVAPFLYETTISSCSTYYWLNAYCVLGEQIRRELGLEIYHCQDTPIGHLQRFHTTIANRKGN